MNGNDAKEQAANTAHVHAVEQAAAQALVEEKESESRFRHYGKGPWAAAISALAVVFSLFQMYASTFSAFDAMTLRSWHIIFLLVLSFLMYPAWKGERRSRTRPTLFDALCIAAGLFSFGYLILNYTEITLRGGYFLPVDYFMASVGVIICFEMARRVVGSLRGAGGRVFPLQLRRGMDSRRVRAYRVFLGPRRRAPCSGAAKGSSAWASALPPPTFSCSCSSEPS